MNQLSCGNRSLSRWLAVWEPLVIFPEKGFRGEPAHFHFPKTAPHCVPALALLGSPLGAGGWEVFPWSGICILSPLLPCLGPLFPCLGALIPCLSPASSRAWVLSSPAWIPSSPPWVLYPPLPGFCILPCLGPLLPSLGPESSPAWVPSSPACVLPPPLVTQTLLGWPARQ